VVASTASCRIVAGLAADLLRAVHDLRDRLEPGRRRDPDVHPHLHAAEQQGVRHVVAVPEVRERQPGEVSPPLADRQEVGERLARMLEVGERVDDGDGGRRRE